MYDSYKYASKLAHEYYARTLDSQQDESLGEADTYGWFAIFVADRVIIQQDTHGFVYATQHATDESLSEAWDQISIGWDEFEDPDW